MRNLIITILVAMSFSALAVDTKKKSIPMAKPKPKTVSVKSTAVKKIEVKKSVTTDSELEKKPVTEPSKLRKDFELATGIVLGEYLADANAEESCQDGRLGIVDYGDEIGLILGARSIVVGIGKDKLEEKYSDCKLTLTSSFKLNVVEEISEEVCEKDGKTIVKTILTLEKDRLSYVKIINTNDLPAEEIKCSANLQKPVKKEEVRIEELKK